MGDRHAGRFLPQDGIKQKERSSAAGESAEGKVSGAGGDGTRHRVGPGPSSHPLGKMAPRCPRGSRRRGAGAPQARGAGQGSGRRSAAADGSSPPRPVPLGRRDRLGSLLSWGKVAAEDAAAAAGAAMTTAARPPLPGPAPPAAPENRRDRGQERRRQGPTGAGEAAGKLVRL